MLSRGGSRNSAFNWIGPRSPRLRTIIVVFLTTNLRRLRKHWVFRLTGYLEARGERRHLVKYRGCASSGPIGLRCRAGPDAEISDDVAVVRRIVDCVHS